MQKHAQASFNMILEDKEPVQEIAPDINILPGMLTRHWFYDFVILE